MRKNAPDLVGNKFGRLTVIERHGISKSKKALWKCICDCGGFAIVTTQDLKNGHTKSCGCLKIEEVKKRSKTHGMSNNNLFFVWFAIKDRCFNQNNKKYKHYGGRGITVCDEWKNDFQAFYDYVSQLPHFDEEGYSIDRINNNGNYEPGNVRWATKTEQANNRNNTIVLTIDKETHTLPEWSRILGVKYNTLYYRYKNNIKIS